MCELIIRCDDFGLTQGTALGTLRALENHCTSSVGAIVNTGLRNDDARALACVPDITVGLHVNIVAGRPLSELSEVPDLVDGNGCFFKSGRYRTSASDLIDARQVACEIRAQVARFTELFGRRPAYLDSHSVFSPSFDRALNQVAGEIGAVCVDSTFSALRAGCKLNMVAMPNNMVGDSYDPLSFLLADEGEVLQHERSFMVFHPAFLDAPLMKISTLREGRMQDQYALSSPELARWLFEQGVQLISIGK